MQVELLIGDAMSLKDKRRVVLSVKDRMRRAHNVSVAEVGEADAMRTAVLGIAAVSNDGRHAQGVLSRILDELRNDRRFSIGDHQTEILAGA
ncbi:MAG: DUF503 family protein [Phycisphaera sp.]|nr:DUF503 family protein [Phycisphaera sp.]